MTTVTWTSWSLCWSSETLTKVFLLQKSLGPTPPLFQSLPAEGCESSMTNLRKPHNPLPSPSLSMILSAELAEVMRKYSSHSELALRHTETEIQEIGPASSNGHQSTNQTLSRRKPVGFGLDLILQSNHQSYSHTSGLIYCTNWSLSWNQLVGRGRQG